MATDNLREPRPRWHRRYQPDPRPQPLTADQRQLIRDMLLFDFDRRVIAARVGCTYAQVLAVAAHVTMGTYAAGGEGA